MAFGTLAGDLSNVMSSATNEPAGKTMTSTSAGKRPTPGSGPKHQPGLSSAQVAASVLPQGKPPPPQAPRLKLPPSPGPARRPQFSSNNPMMMVQPPPVPHPGVRPPYPDARSPQPTMLANGQVLMPPPKGFPLGSAGVHVPPSFIPGMTGLLRR